jgi:hypothetical protein
MSQSHGLVQGIDVSPRKVIAHPNVLWQIDFDNFPHPQVLVQ